VEHGEDGVVLRTFRVLCQNIYENQKCREKFSNPCPLICGLDGTNTFRVLEILSQTMIQVVI
jgi:hypothetical protein